MENGKSALYLAVINQRVKVVELLLERGADANELVHKDLSDGYVRVCFSRLVVGFVSIIIAN